MFSLYVILLVIGVLAVFAQAHSAMLTPVYPAAKPMHIIDTTDDVPIYVTPVPLTIPLDDEWAAAIANNHKEHTMTSTVWPLTTTDTTTCVHRPWSGWNVELDGEYPIGFVAVCEACETNIIKHESGWVDHGSTPSAANLDMLHAEKRHDWYDPENADGFWAEG